VQEIGKADVPRDSGVAGSGWIGAGTVR